MALSRRKLLMSLLPLLGPQNLGARQESQDTPLFRAGANLVALEITVIDRNKKTVDQLRKQDFQVYEDGVEQEIVFFSHETRPVSWGIVLDHSGSMASMMEDVSNAALHSIDAGTPEDDAFIIAFDSDVEVIQDFTSDREKLRRASRKIWASGTTALYDAVAEALDHVRRGRHQKKVLVVVTDGDDNASELRFGGLLRLARKSESLIYTVGFTEGMTLSLLSLGRDTQQELQKLAEETGGLAYFPKGMKECDEACREIALQVSRQYSLGYYPKNMTFDGAWRKIAVTVRAPGMTARARKGYFAPGTAPPAAAWRAGARQGMPC